MYVHLERTQGTEAINNKARRLDNTSIEPIRIVREKNRLQFRLLLFQNNLHQLLPSIYQSIHPSITMKRKRGADPGADPPIRKSRRILPSSAPAQTPQDVASSSKPPSRKRKRQEDDEHDEDDMSPPSKKIAACILTVKPSVPFHEKNAAKALERVQRRKENDGIRILDDQPHLRKLLRSDQDKNVHDRILETLETTQETATSVVRETAKVLSQAMDWVRYVNFHHSSHILTT